MRLTHQLTAILLLIVLRLDATRAQGSAASACENASGLRASAALSCGTSGPGYEVLCGGMSSYGILLGLRYSANAHLVSSLSLSGFGLHANDRRSTLGLVVGSRLPGLVSGLMIAGRFGMETSITRTSDITYRTASTDTWPFITFTGTAQTGTTTIETRSFVVGAALAYDVAPSALLSPTLLVSVDAGRSISVEVSAGFRLGK